MTNNGEGVSSGFTLTDEVPSPLTGIQTGEGCTVEGQTVMCVGGELGVGESRQFTVTALVPEGTTGTVTNTAEVNANEEDSDPSNDTDDHVTEPADDCQAQDSTLVSDSAAAASGSSVTIDVAGNDTIPAGKELEVVADAAHGTVTQNADGTFAYTPEAGFAGTDTFTYMVSGPYCDPQIATVTITVTEDEEPPVPATSLVAAVPALAGAGGLGLRRRLQASDHTLGGWQSLRVICHPPSAVPPTALERSSAREHGPLRVERPCAPLRCPSPRWTGPVCSPKHGPHPCGKGAPLGA